MNGIIASSLEWYKQKLWWTMDVFEVTDSLTRKVMTAATLQFVSLTVLFALPLVFLGREALTLFPPGQILLTMAVFLLASTAYVNTLLIIREDVTQPLQQLQTTAQALTEGRVEETPPTSDQNDEIGLLTRSFVELHGYFSTIVGQTRALADEEFDAAVLDEDVPGEVGASLGGLKHSLESRITELQTQRETIEQRQQALEDDARRYKSAFEECASGDLTQRIETESDSDAMEEIATAFNEMVATLEETLVHIREFAHEVDTASETMVNHTEKAKRMSTDVSRETQEIATGAEKQDGHLQTVSTELTDLSATIEEIASSTDEIAEQSQKTVEQGENGLDAADEALAEMDAIESAAQMTVEEMNELQREVDRIGEIVELIDEIAEQTNMLALNASIEAARAGRAGEGFAVVADEIKGFAEETADATGRVEDLITTVEDSTDDVAKDMRSMQQDIEDGQNAVDRTVETLEIMVENAEQANTGIQSISDASDSQAATTEEVVAMADEVGTISDETATQTDEVVEFVEQQTVTVENLSTQADELSDGATGLRAELSDFEVQHSETSSFDGVATDGGR